MYEALYSLNVIHFDSWKIANSYNYSAFTNFYVSGLIFINTNDEDNFKLL